MIIKIRALEKGKLKSEEVIETDDFRHWQKGESLFLEIMKNGKRGRLFEITNSEVYVENENGKTLFTLGI